jgi:hypothetical protein
LPFTYVGDGSVQSCVIGKVLWWSGSG